MIEFQTDIPLPHEKNLRGASRKYPFGTMPVGASFAMTSVNKNSVYNILLGYRRSGVVPDDWKFTARRVVENGVEVTRVWRIA